LNQIRPRFVQGEDRRSSRDPAKEERPMNPRVSLTGILVAITMFAIAAAMHQTSMSAGFVSNDAGGSDASLEPRKAPSTAQMVRQIIPEDKGLPGRQ